MNRRFAAPPFASLRFAPVPPLNVPRVAVVHGVIVPFLKYYSYIAGEKKEKMKSRIILMAAAALLCLTVSAQPAKQSRPGKYIDFEAVQPDGKVMKLSDYVGKGKYILVDFWASWCGPCREEIPNMKDIYYEFRGEKFDIVGAPVMDKPENTLKAVDELKIPWTQILSVPESVPKDYGFQYIPYIILVGPDGTILETNMRGDGIRAAVKKHLGIK